ncbi:hypothetical protein F5148DRAFT_531940 [Russula earlei]|uniref:Uncharacterized protein n=1 Tax=Russula earlei TaxID=71964 RepID=A0ACC0TYF1_9AGAM|nr:hypothetical protein F5148DRAFT_531940 [Russula earlei]
MFSVSVGMKLLLGYYVADILPLALPSITTSESPSFFVVVHIPIYPTMRLLFQLFILGIVSLVTNAFSTSRWRNVPPNCSAISADYSDLRSSCQHLWALKEFVWLNWVVVVLAALVMLCFSMMQHRSGEKYIWTIPLVRFTPRPNNRRSVGVTYGTSLVEDYLRFSR